MKQKAIAIFKNLQKFTKRFYQYKNNRSGIDLVMVHEYIIFIILSIINNIIMKAHILSIINLITKNLIKKKISRIFLNFLGKKPSFA